MCQSSTLWAGPLLCSLVASLGVSGFQKEGKGEKQGGWGGEWELLRGEGARREAKRGSKGRGRGWAEAAATPRGRPGAS